jgi:hypothetical protein
MDMDIEEYLRLGQMLNIEANPLSIVTDENRDNLLQLFYDSLVLSQMGTEFKGFETADTRELAIYIIHHWKPPPHWGLMGVYFNAENQVHFKFHQRGWTDEEAQELFRAREAIKLAGV